MVADSMHSSDDQEHQLDDALKVVKREAFEMKRCLDREKIMDALKHATNFLGELRTNTLSPKYYYRLFIDVTNELQHLESFVSDFAERGKCPLELYEHVQYAGGIIPRLYLMITIGVVQMKAKMVKRSEMLHDLVEMSRGVQHPLRGLFLRNYLLQTTRNLLPDVSNTMEDDGSIMDAVQFIMSNFGEMNKLWVRMQHQGPSREREKREKERMELRILVGTNMVRLSQLQLLDLPLYRTTVLPAILEQLVSCRDPISQAQQSSAMIERTYFILSYRTQNHFLQEYLMECVVQVFPDDYHIVTLRDLLNACKELHEDVNMKNILSCVMERVGSLAASGDTQLFSLFADAAQGMIHERQMPTEDIVSLHYSLGNLAFKSYPDRVDYAGTVYDSLLRALGDKGLAEQSHLKPIGRELVKVLGAAIEAYGSAAAVSRIGAFSPLLNFLDFPTRCRVAATLLQTMVDRELFISNQAELAAVGVLAKCLLEEDGGILDADDLQSEDFLEEQSLVAKVVHLVRASDAHPDSQFMLLSEARNLLGKGGPKRIPHTLPPLLNQLFRLAQLFAEKKDEIDACDVKLRKLFLFAMSTINVLLEVDDCSAELPLRLYVEASCVADSIPFEDRPSIVYEFISKALGVVEEEVADSRARLSALTILSSALLRLHSLPLSESNSLANQITLLSSKLFKKADQVRALLACAFLFWDSHVDGKNEPIRDGAKVFQIISRAIKMAAQCMEPVVQVQLLVHIISSLHRLYEEGCEEVDDNVVAEVVGRARDCAAQLERCPEAESVERHLAATLAHIKKERARGGALANLLRL